MFPLSKDSSLFSYGLLLTSFKSPVQRLSLFSMWGRYIKWFIIPLTESYGVVHACSLWFNYLLIGWLIIRLSVCVFFILNIFLLMALLISSMFPLSPPSSQPQVFTTRWGYAYDHIWFISSCLPKPTSRYVSLSHISMFWVLFCWSGYVFN